ncbi:PREDICTED: putative pentatricopeptide repeat-containing protein At3g13770, mitochondrial [Ipomoea nil]|uniref:putative pentatricopeptide repeat-containing protein At3g13770, mitochondrial n=1 Tax=Ipomoea nil TaxID=35883 RepID=UPI000901C48F|nr:PREDICTED: putative pentatricopeptide repeat-containing protein At3g13770, mitochondrial [Ipomoea nil]
MEALTTLNFHPDHSRQWNSIIKRQAKLKNDNAILKTYTQMESLGIFPDNTTLPLVLKACGKLQAVERGRKIHGDINGTHLIEDVRVGTALIDFYCKCGSFEDALHAFDGIPEKDVVSWNAMISGSVECREYEVALCLVKEMQRENLRPNSRTAVSLLIASGELSDFRLGMGIHGYCLRNGLLDRNAHVSTSLIGFYSRFDVEVAYRVLESLASRCIASWNAMLSGFLDNGDYMDVLKNFSAMLKKGLNYDPVTILVVIQACGELGSVELGMQVHQLAVKCGYDKDLNVVNALINMYSEMGYTETSYVLFQSSSTKDTALWNSMISAYVERGCTEEAVKLINKMQVEDINVDERTIAIMLPLCLSFANGLRFGNSLHGQVIKLGVENNMYTINALLSMYGELNCVEDALRIFSKTKNLDVMSWNIMISALAHNELCNQAFKLFCQMHETDVKPNSHTIISVLSACSNDTFLCVGRSIHGYAIKQCLDSDPQVNTAITEMYMQCSDEATAMNLFESFGNKDVVSWNAMIANYVNCGEPFKALLIFHHMVIQVEPNLATIINALNSCTHLVHLHQGQCIHAYAMRRASSLGFDLSMANAFISMYARCGCMQYAEKIFKALPKKNIVSWNAMIAGYGMHGRGQDAMLVYSQMLENGFSPSGVTFVSALSACSHSGLIKDGLQLYHSMVNEFGMIPELVHYSCVVDLLARGGLLDEAWNFINSMPISPDASVLRALLGGCRVYGETKHANIIFEKLVELEPMNAGNYVLLSNIYAAAGLWTEVSRLRAMLEEKGLVKPPGKSWILTRNKVHQFIAGDKTHPQCVEIYKKLNSLLSLIKERGYVPDLRWVLHDESEEEKLMRISSHSEKLAIAFGLINVRAGGQILIIKNLRICGDCHEFSKYVSEVTGREIVMRDGNRFHHFINGVCSCKDYW